MGIHRGNRVRIHTQHLALRQKCRKLLLHLLRAEADLFQVSATDRTAHRHRFGMPAVVAHQPSIGMMVGQIDRTRRAGGHMPAIDTGDHAARTAPIQEQDGLLSFFVIFPQRA